MGSEETLDYVQAPAREVRVGVIGCGYWGPNHIRNFAALKRQGARMQIAADTDASKRERVSALYPQVEVVDNADGILGAPEIDAVVVATPANTHYQFASRALEAGKHVLVEKPFVTEIAQATDLLAKANERGLVLMVGHTFEYTAAVNFLRDTIADDDVGDVMYVRSLRVNLGLFQKDINVLWDLAPHDISILLYVLNRLPTSVSAVGQGHITSGIEDVVSMSLNFGDSLMANVIVSWLDPRKVREMTIVGTKKMLVYNDVSANEKIRIFDRGVNGPRTYDSFGEFHYSYRYGDIITPRLNEYEPLREEALHFLECIQFGKVPRSSGQSGLRVTSILQSATKSLASGGAEIPIEFPDQAGGITR